VVLRDDRELVVGFLLVCTSIIAFALVLAIAYRVFRAVAGV